LRQQEQQWDELGRTDPLWAILTDPARRHSRWDPAEFFATGAREVEPVIERAAALGFPAARRTALDFGCGVGRLTQALADHYDQVTGIDIAPAMLKLAREFNCHGDRCRYVLNNQNHLRAFPDAAFDLVFSRITLQHLPRRHIREYLREFVRILRPGGLLHFQLPAAHRYSGWRHFLLDNIYRTVTRKILRNPNTFDMYALPRRQVTALLEGEGARLLEVVEDDAAGAEWLSLQYFATR
jgi:SAM-dependent methyltransferase